AAPDPAPRPAAIRSHLARYDGRAFQRSNEMSYPYIHTALAHERQNTLLEEAQAARQAREARMHRRARGTRAVHGSPLRRVPGRLASAWGRVVTSQPRSSTEATG